MNEGIIHPPFIHLFFSQTCSSRQVGMPKGTLSGGWKFHCRRFAHPHTQIQQLAPCALANNATIAGTTKTLRGPRPCNCTVFAVLFLLPERLTESSPDACSLPGTSPMGSTPGTEAAFQLKLQPTKDNLMSIIATNQKLYENRWRWCFDFVNYMVSSKFTKCVDSDRLGWSRSALESCALQRSAHLSQPWSPKAPGRLSCYSVDREIW